VNISVPGTTRGLCPNPASPPVTTVLPMAGVASPRARVTGDDRSLQGRILLAGADRISPGRILLAGVLLALACLGASCAGTTSSRTDPPGGAPSTTLDPRTPLAAPKTSTLQDTQYLADVAQADGALASYIQTQGNAALQALLTDGSAFCAFLQRDGNIDDAMASLADGARGMEAQTHLPMTVATFNTIDAVALLTLCPSEQKLLPAADQAKISQLGRELTSQPG
jgi:hypothetical protein